MATRGDNGDPEVLMSPLLELLDAAALRFGDLVALSTREESGWMELTYAELYARTRTLAGALVEMGVEAGDRIAILSESRPEWAIALVGSLRADAVVVPLDTRLTESELLSILDDCAPKLLFVSAAFRDQARNLRTTARSVGRVIVLQDGAGDADCPSIRDLRAENPRSIPKCSGTDTALVVYVSATRDAPKGVMITHANLAFEVQAIARAIDGGPADRFLSVLPLNHLLELTGGLLALLNVGAAIYYAQSFFPQDLLQLVQEKAITAMIGVPILFRSLKVAIEGRDHGALGALRILISGGAPLDVEVARFFDQLGFPILQGYGLTEASPVISVNRAHANRIGSVGRPLDGVEVRIDGEQEGEILTRGPHVMKGYYRHDDWTREAIDSKGWLHTGDLGRIDPDGFIHLTGRLKNVIVLGNGKKVFPEEVERALARASTIKEACVIGRPATPAERMEQVCAVAVPADSLAARWEESPQAVEQLIAQEVEHLTRELAPYKRPSRLYIHPGELPKTALRKICRPLVHLWLDERAYRRAS